MRVLVLLLGVVLAGSGRADNGPQSATFQTGNQLLSNCESDDMSNRAMCYGYLVGVADSIEYNHMALPGAYSSNFFYTHSLICIPEGTIVGQLLKVWVKWANENPEDLHQRGYSLVLYAFAEAWPCIP